MTEEVLVF